MAASYKWTYPILSLSETDDRVPIGEDVADKERCVVVGCTILTLIRPYDSA